MAEPTQRTTFLAKYAKYRQVRQEDQNPRNPPGVFFLVFFLAAFLAGLGGTWRTWRERCSRPVDGPNRPRVGWAGMVLVTHVPFYREIFAIPEFLRDPLICFGFQEFDKGATLDGKQYLHLGEYFATLGVRATSLDLFDPRSELRYEMNHRVPEHEHGRYATFIDIGSLEHVFDTRQCFENCLRMVAPGGHYLLHTPVNGYYAHGFHV